MKYNKILLDKIIKYGFETNHIDFKVEFNWYEFTDYKKAKVVKHIAAMSNILGGGMLIFGVSDSRQIKGLSDYDISTLDRTKLDQTLAQYLDPVPAYNITKSIYENKQLLILEVSEFGDVPIICKQEYIGVLKVGGIYIRKNASSTLIQDALSMRYLLDLAIKKKKEDLVKSINDLLSSKLEDNWKL